MVVLRRSSDHHLARTYPIRISEVLESARFLTCRHFHLHTYNFVATWLPNRSRPQSRVSSKSPTGAMVAREISADVIKYLKAKGSNPLLG